MSSITVAIVESITESINSTFTWLLYSNKNEDNIKYGKDINIIPLNKVIVIDNSSKETEKFNEFEMISSEFDSDISNVVVKTSTVSVENSFHSANEKQIFAQMVAMS